jgi:hypothetical protein
MANEFVSFNPYDEQIEALRQRQRMADMLRQQSMEPLESQVAPGGYVVPTSPLLGLAKMLQAYGAGRSQRAIDKELGELRSRAAYDTRQQQAEQTAAMKGIVGRLTGQRDEVGPMEQAVLTGAPMPPKPPKPITVTPQMDRAANILSGKTEDLAEFEPTAQYRYDPEGAQQMVMSSPAFDASTRGQMLAAALKQTMEKPEAEEFGTTPVLGADGKYYVIGKGGSMKPTGVAGPPKTEPGITPYQKKVLGLREQELAARTTPGKMPLSATAQKEIIETDQNIAAQQSGIKLLNDALALSPKAFEGVGAAKRAYAASNLTESLQPAGTSETLEFDNLMTQQILPQLRTVFGSNPTEGERRILLEMQGSSSLPRKTRENLITRAITAAETRLKFDQQKLAKLRAGEYFAEPIIDLPSRK